jgi:ABC-type nitrate/sulfonate/bicarbonate transport system substrate-binding protein
VNGKFIVALAAAASLSLAPLGVPAVEKLIGIHSARVLSQSMPWIAQEAGLFKKYNLDFSLVYIASSPLVTAAMLGGDAEIGLTGGEGNIRAYVQGATDFVFIGAVKNILTHSILAGPGIKRPEDLKGKKIGINRIGTNPHYFAVQALRQKGLDPAKDVQLIQSGGSPETLAALISGNLDAAALNPPADTQALAQGFHYVINGLDLKISYIATSFVTRRQLLAKRSPVVAQFMHAMAEAAKILHTDREYTYKVLAKYLRVSDRKILDASYNSEIKSLEPRLEVKPEGIQAILDEVAKVDPRAKNIKAESLIDRRYLDEMEKSGFFDKLWEEKR